MNEVYIISTKRTPIGSFNGSLANIAAPQLGATCIKALLEETQIPSDAIQEVFMGNVLSAGLGQAPARQAAIFAGLSDSIPCTTINKVCASGMKAITVAAQSIMTGQNDVVIAGGMENMSAVPHYLPHTRKGFKLGHQILIDGLILDGLTDVYNQYHMGNAAELCAKTHHISREEQDSYAIESYNRAKIAWDTHKFKKEIAPVSIPQRKGEPILFDQDEEYTQVKFDKIPQLRPVFQKEGTVTAANASTLNDGAAAILLVSKKALEQYQLTPIAKIISFGDAAQAPELFTTAPSLAIPIALKRANKSIEDIDLFEINEAFSVVSLANAKLLHLDSSKTNIYGGAVSLGHPLGCSGARIVSTLLTALGEEQKTLGIAGICNGGGGASALLVEKL